jgi:hypothetical protein
MSEKYYTDPAGEKIPAKYIPAYDKNRDRIANQIAKLWCDEEARLSALKEKTIGLIEKLQQFAAKSAGVADLGGEAGYIQFRSFDGAVTVSLENAKRTEFDERLTLAQQLIMEAVKDLSQSVSNADLVEIATRAFQPRRCGNLDMQRIRELKNYKVSHPKWKQAVNILSECERIVGRRRYVRVTVRADRDSRPRPITLDIARL